MMVAKMLLGKMIGIGIGIRGVMLLPFSILRPIDKIQRPTFTLATDDGTASGTGSKGITTNSTR